MSPAPKTILKIYKYWKFKCWEVSEWSEMVNISSLCRYLNINFSYWFWGFFYIQSLVLGSWFETQFRREPNKLLTFDILLSLRVSKREKQLRIQCHAYLPVLLTPWDKLLLDPTNRTPSEPWTLEAHPSWPNKCSIKMGALMLFMQLFQHWTGGI